MGDDEVEHGLVMPFLPVTSKGGPWDDGAYCAGFEMGLLDAKLARHRGLLDACLVPPPELLVTGEMTIQADNREQADLIAMRHGFHAETALSDVEGWVFLRFWPAVDNPEVDRG